MIPGWSVTPWLFGVLGALSAALIAAVWRRQALRRRWLDIPGPRRLHAVPTPRGGGIAIAAVLLAATPGLGEGGALVALGLLLTAGTGLMDDLRPLPPLTKLCLQAVGALPLALAWPLASSALGPWAGPVTAWLLVMVLVNFWNFIDGSNGLAASQALLIAAAVAWFTGMTSPAGWLGLALMSGCVGFLPFNLPKARLFLGDVGSFTLGYGVAALLLMAQSERADAAWPLLLLPSAVLMDTGLTLLVRLGRRQKVWVAHREHLYQRAVRHGWSHVRVCLAYGVWTVLASVAAWITANAGQTQQVTVLGLFIASAGMLYLWAGRHWPIRDDVRDDMESAG